MSGLALSIYYSKTSQTMIAQSYYENERTVTTTQPLIIIDAGHGGIDPGSDSQGILEKDINLEIALKLQEVLIENGYAVLMTREDDSSLELRERSDFANEQEADLFISLHQNCYAQDESVNGIEVYYNSDKTTNDQQLAQMIQEALINETGAKNRGIRSDNGLVVTRETKMPAVLVETAFISNDYLGMSQREETKQAGIDAIKKYGTGACAAQVIGGYLDIHQQLEKEIASFVGQEEAILFSSGFGANAGILRALLGQNDIALIDPYIHTSAMAGLKGTNITSNPQLSP